MAYPYQSYQNPYLNPYQPYAAYQQPQIQPVQQPQPTMPMQSGIVWVGSLMEAQNYPIAPNNAVALWEKSGKTIYLKSADATGKPNLVTYDLVERTAQEAQTQAPAYATKEDLSAVAGAVSSFDGVLATLKAEIDAMKGDLYGIAGKKKPVKKTEGEDE